MSNLPEFWVTTESGVPLIEPTRDKVRKHLDQLLHISQRTEITRDVLEQYQMNESADLNAGLMVAISENGGFQEVLKNKSKKAKVLSWVDKFLDEHLESMAADEEKKAAERAKQEAAALNRKKNILKAFHFGKLKVTESMLLKMIHQIAGTSPDPEIIGKEEDAIILELEKMAEEKEIGWVMKGQGTPGIVLMIEDGEPTPVAKEWKGKLQFARPQRGKPTNATAAR